MKKLGITVILLLIFGGIGIFSLNFFELERPMKEVMADDYRNRGIKISVHYDNYIDTNVLIYNLEEVNYDKSAVDVFRVLWQFSEKLSDKNFDKIILFSKGKPKFYILGKYFKKLGKEYGTQNPIYVMRTFPENVYTMEGKKAFNEWTGGLLGVATKQMEEFNEFNQKWFIDDL